MNPQDILNQLKAQGIDTNQIIAQLEQEGYDTRPLQQTPLQKSVEQEGPGLQNVSATPVTGPDIQQAGVDAAEGLAKRGVNPNIAAATGTAIQMAPTVAGMAATGGFGAPAEGTMAARVLSGPGRQEAGAAINAAEKAVGINTDVIPTIKDVTANLGLKNASAKEYLNALMSRLKSGDEMGPQALSQHHKMVTDLLANEPTGVIGKLSAKKATLGPSGVAQASRINNMLVGKLNEAAPGRAEAAADYAAAKLRQKAALYGGGAIAGLAGKNAILDAFNRITGGH